MAWRPTWYSLEGELGNTIPGKVTGWMRFAGLADPVTFDLDGDFHRDIRGTKIRLAGDGRADDPTAAPPTPQSVRAAGSRECENPAPEKHHPAV